MKLRSLVAGRCHRNYRRSERNVMGETYVCNVCMHVGEPRMPAIYTYNIEATCPACYKHSRAKLFYRKISFAITYLRV